MLSVINRTSYTERRARSHCFPTAPGAHLDLLLIGRRVQGPQRGRSVPKGDGLGAGLGATRRHLARVIVIHRCSSEELAHIERIVQSTPVGTPNITVAGLRSLYSGATLTGTKYGAVIASPAGE